VNPNGFGFACLITTVAFAVFVVPQASTVKRTGLWHQLGPAGIWEYSAGPGSRRSSTNTLNGPRSHSIATSCSGAVVQSALSSGRRRSLEVELADAVLARIWLPGGKRAFEDDGPRHPF
jgi:hypothetical protein